jgi:hypothetical protein
MPHPERVHRSAQIRGILRGGASVAPGSAVPQRASVDRLKCRIEELPHMELTVFRSTAYDAVVDPHCLRSSLVGC